MLKNKAAYVKVTDLLWERSRVFHYFDEVCPLAAVRGTLQRDAAGREFDAHSRPVLFFY